MNNNTIQAIFRQHGDNFRALHQLSAVQLKAMKAIENCATEQAGFHSFVCVSCGYTEVAYNSCSNRHCPNCQWLKQEIWVDKVKSLLLPVKYVHIVFTLPDFLNDFVLINHKLLYNILFEASWLAVNKCASSYLGAQRGWNTLHLTQSGTEENSITNLKNGVPTSGTAWTGVIFQ